MITTAPQDLPSTKSPAVLVQTEELTIVRDLDAGQQRMIKRGQKYLPKHPAETAQNYEIRLKRPSFYNSFSRAHEALTGLVFQKDPVIDTSVPTLIQEHLVNVDNAGTNVMAFLKFVFDDILVAGHGAILVDMPTVIAADSLTLGEERSNANLGIRPYWNYIRKDNIVSWRTVVENGRTLLNQVVLEEILSEDVGQYGSQPTTQYRVLKRNGGMGVTYEVIRIIDNQPIPVEMGSISPITEIPLIPIYSNRVDLLISRPPLIDLGNQNILHYQVTADMLHAAHLANVPILVGKNVDQSDLDVGPNVGIRIDENSELNYVESTGAGIAASMNILKSLEDHMSILGSGLLAGQAESNVTAESQRLGRIEHDSIVASTIASIENGLKSTLDIHAEFLGLDDGGSINLNREYRGDADQIIRGAVSQFSNNEEK